MKKMILMATTATIMFSLVAQSDVAAKTQRFQQVVTTKKIKNNKYHMKNTKQVLYKLSTTKKKKKLKITTKKLTKANAQKTLYVVKSVKVKKPKGTRKWSNTTYYLLAQSKNGKQVGYAKKTAITKGAYVPRTPTIKSEASLNNKYHFKDTKEQVYALSTTKLKKSVKITKTRQAAADANQKIRVKQKVVVQVPNGDTKWKATTYYRLETTSGASIGYVLLNSIVKGEYQTVDEQNLAKGFATGSIAKKRLADNQATIKKMLTKNTPMITANPIFTDWATEKKALILGDSIAKGTEYINGKATVTAKPFITTALLNLGVSADKIQNSAFSGSGVFAYVKADAPQNLGWQITNRNISAFSVVFLSYGTNDWAKDKQGAKTLLDDATELNRSIQAIREMAPTAKIFGVLPLDRFDAKKVNLWNNIGKQGFTLEELSQAYAQVYAANGVPAFDWHTGNNNVISNPAQMSDGKTHPNDAGYALMTATITPWLAGQVSPATASETVQSATSDSNN